MKKTNNKSDKQLLVTLLLAIFVGAFGIHRFYVGKIGSGIAMLLLTLSFIGLLVTGIWALIDIIIIATGNFKDKEGKLVL